MPFIDFPMIILHCPFIRAGGMALWPFILVRDRGDMGDLLLLHHEQIHLRQQIEMLLLPFYIVYAGHYLFNLLRYRDHDKAYREIIFEREAYQMEDEIGYLERRSMWNWMKF